MVETRKIRTAADTSRELEEELNTALAHPTEIFGYGRYGDGVKDWVRLDKLTGGLQYKTLSVLAARPKRGKSMLAAAWVPYIAQQAIAVGETVRVVTLEMQRKSYQRRMAAMMAGIRDPMNIRRGVISKQEQVRYRNALTELRSLPIEYLSNEEDLSFEDTMKRGNSPVTFAEVSNFIRARDGEPTYWWVLDHIGLLNDVSPDGDMVKSIYSLANKLAALAHQVATGLVVTHLTRQSTGAMPTIESIAGSDQVGRNADQIFLLSRPFMDAPDLSDEDRDKVADGEPAFLQFYSRDEGSGLDILWWKAEYASFEELDIPEGYKVPLPAAKRKKA